MPSGPISFTELVDSYSVTHASTDVFSPPMSVVECLSLAYWLFIQGESFTKDLPQWKQDIHVQISDSVVTS